uniref:Uncharacterized protein n=1 Tax=Arundo donax TaxID=35708 RepID=A0A0A9ASS6_ARUDO
MSQTLPGCCIWSGIVPGLKPNIAIVFHMPGQGILETIAGSTQAGYITIIYSRCTTTLNFLCPAQVKL